MVPVAAPPVAPNLTLLQNALDQTQGAKTVDAGRWMEAVRGRLLAMNMKAIFENVAAFLERPQDAALMNRENLLGLLDRAS